MGCAADVSSYHVCIKEARNIAILVLPPKQSLFSLEPILISFQLCHLICSPNCTLRRNHFSHAHYFVFPRVNDEKDARGYLQALARKMTEELESVKQANASVSCTLLSSFYMCVPLFPVSIACSLNLLSAKSLLVFIPSLSPVLVDSPRAVLVIFFDSVQTVVEC